MAGGLGSRLKPLTDNIPKPLLKVGDKSSIQHNMDRLSKFGITNYYLCLNHMKDKIVNHLNELYSNKEDKIFNFAETSSPFKSETGLDSAYPNLFAFDKTSKKDLFSLSIVESI